MSVVECAKDAKVGVRGVIGPKNMESGDGVSKIMSYCKAGYHIMEGTVCSQLYSKTIVQTFSGLLHINFLLNYYSGHAMGHSNLLCSISFLTMIE